MQYFESLPARRPLNVLLVEDDDIDARIIALVTDLIEAFELRVTRVSSLVDAKSAIDRTKFDVCLLDFWLGKESSLRFLSALEAMDSHIGTVVLSNISPKEAANFRLATHRNYFLPKVSCTPQHLQQAIESVAPPIH